MATQTRVNIGVMPSGSEVVLIVAVEPLLSQIGAAVAPWMPCITAASTDAAIGHLMQPHRRFRGLLVDAAALAESPSAAAATICDLWNARASMDLRLLTSAAALSTTAPIAAEVGASLLLVDANLLSVTQVARVWKSSPTATIEDDDDLTVAIRLRDVHARGDLSRRQLIALQHAVSGASYVETARRLGVSRTAIFGLSARMQARTGRTLHQWALEVCEGTGRRIRQPSDR